MHLLPFARLNLPPSQAQLSPKIIFGRESVPIVGGQALWAVSQALIVFVIANQGRLELLGVFTLGLGIFTPLCLLGSFNLRTLLAIDSEETIDFRAALTLRILVSVVSLLITGLVIYPVAGDRKDLFLVVTLVAVRISDQLSDIAVGHFQRNGTMGRIGSSFAVRGCAVFIPFASVLLSGGGLSRAAACALGGSLAASCIFDLWPCLRETDKSASSTITNLVKGLGTTIRTSPFPALDSLHTNTLRFGVYLFMSTKTLGLVGVAQALYAPIQLIIGAMGYIYLAEAKSLVDEGTELDARRHVWRGVTLGFVPGCMFLVFAVLVPEAALKSVFDLPGGELRAAILVVAIAMLPLPSCGFTAQALVARSNYKHYVLGPLVGLAVFWVGALLILNAIEAPNLFSVSLIFAASGLMRLMFNTRVLITSNRFEQSRGCE